MPKISFYEKDVEKIETIYRIFKEYPVEDFWIEEGKDNITIKIKTDNGVFAFMLRLPNHIALNYPRKLIELLIFLLKKKEIIRRVE